MEPERHHHAVVHACMNTDVQRISFPCLNAPAPDVLITPLFTAVRWTVLLVLVVVLLKL